MSDGHVENGQRQYGTSEPVWEAWAEDKLGDHLHSAACALGVRMYQRRCGDAGRVGAVLWVVVSGHLGRVGRALDTWNDCTGRCEYWDGAAGIEDSGRKG